ncbi:MAG: flagellar basal-body MS-ring/collar protein FliF [Pseudomonadota bacterium]
MAIVNTEQLASQFQGFSKLPALRQLGLMLGLAASVALGVGVVLWSQQPNYSLLYASISAADAGHVVDALDKFGITYRLDLSSNALMVPSDKVHEIRLKLATLGLPKSDVTGLEFLDKDQSLGTSRMIETARFHRALAGELSRSIATLESVDSARVHLAIPKQSVFIRNRTKASASVLVNLHPGRKLDESRIAGIVHLVASSITGLEADEVAVIDQQGHLLTEGNVSGELARRNSRLKYNEQVEQSYVKRIMDILTPIVGTNGVRAQVTADVDFTSVEKTSETFKPDAPAIRSEQLDERQLTGSEPLGIPGALTNRPTAEGPAAGGERAPVTTTKRATRNYELDRTLSHSRNVPGQIQRLSVAVVVDYRRRYNEAGKAERVPLRPEEMDYITTLVKEAVGFKAQRGDSVNVINASFVDAKEFEPLPEPPLWEQPWIFDALKQFMGVALVLILVFGVLRPVMQGLVQESKALPAGSDHGQLPGSEDSLSLTHQGGDGGVAAIASEDGAYQDSFQQVVAAVQEDPKRVSQVVKGWLAAEDN